MESTQYTDIMVNFFEFEDKYSRSTIQAGPIDSLEDRATNLLRGVYNEINFPLIFQQEYGELLTDILGTGHCNLYLISDKFKKTLEENNLTGWKTYPIILFDKQGQKIPNYHGLSISGRCSKEDFSESKIIEKKFVEKGPIVKFYKGLKVTPDTEVDFFMPPVSLTIYLSKNAALILQKNKLKHLKLTPIDQIELDCAIIDPHLREDRTRL
jgi:hypothetical protein